MPAHVPLAVVTRGGAVESVHYGTIAVVDVQGKPVWRAGDPGATVFTRSTLKPLQALAFVRDGGVERFGYSTGQVALLCASHAGEPRHVEAVADMLARAGNRVEQLGCGSHVPGFYEGSGQHPPPPPYSPLAHNCSGKHAGMLAACTLQGWSHHDYLDPGHLLQRSIRSAVAEFARVDASQLVEGIDGCSAPNYAMPLAHLAGAFARLARAPTAGSALDRAAARLRDAMVAAPEMVSGTGRSDARLMDAVPGDWVAKIGAEGVQALGMRTAGLGIAVKVADGGRRALVAILLEVLDQLGLDGRDLGGLRSLQALARPQVRNYRGTTTGAVEPVFRLEGC